MEVAHADTTTNRSHCFFFKATRCDFKANVRTVDPAKYAAVKGRIENANATIFVQEKDSCKVIHWLAASGYTWDVLSPILTRCCSDGFLRTTRCPTFRGLPTHVARSHTSTRP